MIKRLIADWHLTHIATQDIPSETRRMPALIIRLTTAG
jgi:hypothetical protein